MNKFLELEPLLSAKDVQKLLRISLALVYRMADRGDLRCVRWVCPGKEGRREKTTVRFKKTDIIDFIEKNYKKEI